MENRHKEDERREREKESDARRKLEVRYYFILLIGNLTSWKGNGKPSQRNREETTTRRGKGYRATG